MMRSIWEKIEWVREQPEHVRMRYVFSCLVVSMLFILGIWVLSLQENFRTVGEDIPSAIEKGKALLPKNEDQTSLNTLSQQAAPLRVDGQNKKTGQEYFEEQWRTQTNTG